MSVANTPRTGERQSPGGTGLPAEQIEIGVGSRPLILAALLDVVLESAKNAELSSCTRCPTPSIRAAVHLLVQDEKIWMPAYDTIFDPPDYLLVWQVYLGWAWVCPGIYLPGKCWYGKGWYCFQNVCYPS